VLRGLRREGFEPFMVAQGRGRIESKTEYTKHMTRMRHLRDGSGQVNARPEANEIILINSHDGASSYQLLAGLFRFVCCNGMVIGDVTHDIRIPNKGNIQGEVIEGAFRVLDDFDAVEQSTDAMKAIALQPEEERAFARAESKHGKRLNPRKADLHPWRENFAAKLHGHGIEAEATRQATRGRSRNYDPLWRVKAREEGRLRATRPGAKRGRRANATRAEAVEAWKQLGQALAMSADPADLAHSRSIASLLVVFNGLRLLGGEREFNGEAGPAK